jgi:FAD/FMN-containing dehydrogenase
MADVRTSRFELDGFRGQLLHPGDDGYDEARKVFNAMIDRSPALVARCASADDVAAVVKLAGAENLPLSVYGGGHGVTGSAVCDAGLCVDLRGMKGIEVDAGSRTVRAEAGLTWGELDAATQAHGLAVTGGRVSTTGIAGLALGSGSGWLERKVGFVCDNLIQAEVVTADGRQVIASEQENDDLFWGLRGGGGNFGVVTAFHLRLHPIGPIVLGGMLMYPAAMARDVVRFWRDFMLGAPDEVGSGLAFITAPPEEFVPEPVRGQPVIGIVLCYAGPVEEGEKTLQPLREFGPPGIDLVQAMPYVAVQQLLDAANPKGLQNYWSADFYAELPDEAVDVLVEQATKPVSPMTQLILMAGGGAIARVPEDATAFGQRTAPWNMHYLSMWTDPADAERNIAYTRAIASAMKPWTTGRAYLNFIGDEGAGRVEAAFGPEKFARLQALKRKWDPDNLFRHNQNIPPAPK